MKKQNNIVLGLRWNPFETHHMYYGFVLIGMGIKDLIDDQYLLGIFEILFGIYLVIDDIYQHTRQRLEEGYHSPVHVFIYDYLHLYDNKLFRKLNEFADWFFGLFKTEK